MEVSTTTFHKKKSASGSLSFLEAERDIPFNIKRVYYIYDVNSNERRGFHAHKTLQQYLICTHGSCKVLLDNAKEKEILELSDSNIGLYVGPRVWHEMFDFVNEAVLLVLASDYYDENDYIRDYNDFLKYMESFA